MPRITEKIVPLSTEASIGKLLILIGIILQVIAIASIFALSAFSPWMGGMMNWMMGWGMYGGAIGGAFSLIGLVQIAGLIAGIYAYREADRHNFNRAGYLAIVSSILPPLQIVMLIGGILIILSREGRR